MIENGQRGISVEIALRICEILKKSVEELFDAAEVHATPSTEQAATLDATGTEQ